LVTVWANSLVLYHIKIPRNRSKLAHHSVILFEWAAALAVVIRTAAVWT
jgi:hypothetical protein